MNRVGHKHIDTYKLGRKVGTLTYRSGHIDLVPSTPLVWMPE